MGDIVCTGVFFACQGNNSKKEWIGSNLRNWLKCNNKFNGIQLDELTTSKCNNLANTTSGYVSCYNFA
jgi:hypothetical protein